MVRSLLFVGLVSMTLTGCPDTESPAGPWETGPRIDAGGLPDVPEVNDAPATEDAPTPDAAMDDAPASDAGTVDDAGTDDAGLDAP